MTVVLPTFDRALLLPSSIGSVLRQQFDAGFELIVVDDGSRDGTADALEGQADPRVRLLRTPHRGVSAARNEGLREARGDVVTFLDSDDEALPGWLAALAAPFADPRVAVVCCGAEVTSDRPGEWAKRIMLPQPLGRLYHRTTGLYLAGTYAARRRMMQEIGGFDEDLRFSENSELAIRLVELCVERGSKIVSLDRPLVHYRRTGERPWQQVAEERLAATLHILQEHREGFRRDARERGRYHRVAAVDATRLERRAEARRLLLGAIAARPWNVRDWLHLMATWIPPLARRIWSGAGR